jgi:Tol biopolymer transport system component
VFDVDSRASVSPDGKQLAFVRNTSGPQQGHLIVLDLGTKRERILAQVNLPSEFLGSPAWSPDGQRIAAAIGDTGPGLESTIALFEPRDGRRRDWLKLPLSIPTSLAWLRGGTALAVTGQFLRSSIYRHVVVYPYPSGRASRVTNDFSEYANLTASLADETIATTRASRNTSIYIAAADAAGAHRLTSGSGPENSFHQATALDSSTILSTSPRNGVLQLWATGTDDAESRALTGTEAHAFRPFAAAGTIVFDRLDSTGIKVWTMNTGGGSARALTHSARKQTVDLSADGRHVLVEGDGRGKLSVIATADGRVERDLGAGVSAIGLSPDSRSVLVGRPEPDTQGRLRNVYEVLPIEGGAATSVARPPASAVDVRWVPDGRSVSYIDRSDPAWNVFRSSFAGGAPIPVTHITDGRVVRHAWSPDGRRLGVLVRAGERVDLWVTDAEGRKPVRVTQISPETITSFSWMADSRRLVVEASTRPSDVVLIRDFR